MQYLLSYIRTKDSKYYTRLLCRMGDAMKKILYSVRLDRGSVSFWREGCNIPEAKAYHNSPATIAAIYRDAAFYFLEAAHWMEHSNDFVTPDFTRDERRHQVALMLDAHKPIFTKEAQP